MFSGRAADVRPEAAMHGHAHVFVDPIAVWLRMAYCSMRGETMAHSAELAARKHILIERGHGARRAVPAPPGAPLLRHSVELASASALKPLPTGIGSCHGGGAGELRLGQADIEFVAEPERLGDGVADDVAESRPVIASIRTPRVQWALSP